MSQDGFQINIKEKLMFFLITLLEVLNLTLLKIEAKVKDRKKMPKLEEVEKEKEDTEKKSDESQSLAEADSDSRSKTKDARRPPLRMVVDEVDSSEDEASASSSSGDEPSKKKVERSASEEETIDVDEEAALSDEDGFDEEDLPEKKKLPSLIFNKKNALIALIVVCGLALIGGGVFIYKKTIGTKESSPPEASQEKPQDESSLGGLLEGSPAPSPTPAPEPKREDLKIQVLNGTGAPGIAGEAKEFLEGLGYKDIDTGNADAYDYKETEISIKEDKKDYLEQLTGDLSEKYTLADETKILDEESEFDTIVVVGKK